MLPPTMMASDLARASNTSLRESGEDTHDEWPLLHAILPSAVIAYLSSDSGRPVAALWSSACTRRMHGEGGVHRGRTEPYSALQRVNKTSPWLPRSTLRGLQRCRYHSSLPAIGCSLMAPAAQNVYTAGSTAQEAAFLAGDVAPH